MRTKECTIHLHLPSSLFFESTSCIQLLCQHHRTLRWIVAFQPSIPPHSLMFLIRTEPAWENLPEGKKPRRPMLQTFIKLKPKVPSDTVAALI